MNLLKKGDQCQLSHSNCKYPHRLVYPAPFYGCDNLIRRELIFVRADAISDTNREENGAYDCNDL